MKVNRLEPMASPARSRDGGCTLPRSTSGKAPPSPSFSSNTSHQPARASSISEPTTPASHHKPPAINTDAQPATPTEKGKSSSRYSSLWSPRKLMQRASRAFRGGKSRRKKNKDGDSPTSVTSKGSDAASVLFLDELTDDVHGGAKQEQNHLEIVPEKIIHEANPSVVVNHQPAVAVEECMKAPEKETAASVEEEPMKGAAPARAVADAITDKFMVMKEAVRRFEGSRVKTAMEKRSEEEQPRRREVARSNDVIEEARSKLLERRQCSRVKALVGAFETVMDTNHAAAAGKQQLHLRKEA